MAARDAGPERIKVWGGGSPSRGLLYVDAAAEGIVSRDRRREGRYVIVSGGAPLPDSQPRRGWRTYVQRIIAAEVSALTRYVDRVVQWLPLPHDDGALLDTIDCPTREVAHAEPPAPRDDEVVAVLLNGTLNHELDIEARLRQLKQSLKRCDRAVLVAYNPFVRGLYVLASRLGLREGEVPPTFVTRVDLDNLARLAGFEVTRVRPAVFVPFKLLGLGALVNRVLPATPGLNKLALTNVITLRPVVPMRHQPTLTVVIPARDERGNIESALQRLAAYEHIDMEVIFVEGHSTDGTWEEIQRVLPLYADRFRLKAFRQPGIGKADAVRHAFGHATGELLTILDADLTMPPELLGRFYDAYCAGLADFINGSRLVYPMEGDAMRFLNRLGNAFFAKALSAVLGVRLGDSLCGTKLVSRRDYERFVAWRGDFGDFDPFGDFELLFPAAVLGLGIVDIPVRYRARTYGATSISRFRHGLQLLRLTAIGLHRISTAAYA